VPFALSADLTRARVIRRKQLQQPARLEIDLLGKVIWKTQRRTCFFKRPSRHRRCSSAAKRLSIPGRARRRELAPELPAGFSNYYIAPWIYVDRTKSPTCPAFQRSVRRHPVTLDIEEKSVGEKGDAKCRIKAVIRDQAEAEFSARRSPTDSPCVAQETLIPAKDDVTYRVTRVYANAFSTLA